MAAVSKFEIVGLDGPAIEAMRRSVDSFVRNLPAIEFFPEMLRDLIDPATGDLVVDAADKLADLIVPKVVDCSALRADEISFRCEPSNRYLELVTAIATNSGDRLCISLEHGWPILSVRCGNLTVTEAGGANNAPGGGVA